jgi:hypothetical protein
MNVELIPGYRERLALFGRIGLMVCIAPTLFLIWHAIGLPALPATHFGSSAAPADNGIVVQIAHPPDAAVRAFVRRVQPAAPRTARATTSVVATAGSPAPARARVLFPSTVPPVSKAPAPKPPDATPQTEPPSPPEDNAPTAAGPSETPHAQAAATVDVTLTVQPPPLPVQLPPVSISVPLPSLPAVPVLAGVKLPGLP